MAAHAPLTGEQVAALRGPHDEIPTREGHWPHDIEGAYAPVEELASIEHLGRRWLFSDHGHRTLEWSDHRNRGYTPWILQEHGIDAVAWGQRYAVVTVCRLLYTLTTAEVASKAGALKWASNSRPDLAAAVRAGT